MSYKLDLTNIDRVETDIVSKFDKVITIPIHNEHGDTGFAIYLGMTNIASYSRKWTHDGHTKFLRDAEILRDIASKLELTNKKVDSNEGRLEVNSQA